MPSAFGYCAHAFNLMFGLVCLGVIYKYYRELRGGARRAAIAVTCVVSSLTLMSLCFLCTGFNNLAFQFFHALAMLTMGVAIGIFSDTLWIVAQYSLRMTSPSTFDTLSPNRTQRPLHLRWIPASMELKTVNMLAIRICFAVSACIIALPFTFVFFYIASLGNPTAPDFDVVAYNNAVVYSVPAMASHNFIFFPSFVILGLFLLQTLGDSIDARKKTATTTVPAAGYDKGAQHNLAQLEAVRVRLRVFLVLAITVLAPGEFLFLVVLFPAVYAPRAPGMYLVVFFTFILFNFSLSIVLFTLKSRVVKVVAPVIIEAETAQTEWRAQTRKDTLASRASVVSSVGGQTHPHSELAPVPHMREIEL